MEKFSSNRKLIFNEMGLGLKSAQILSQIIKIGGSISKWTLIDLSLNKLGANLGPIIGGL